MRNPILIVDDEPEFCISLSELLRETGHTCIYTTNPREAMSILDSKPISLILMDVRMPEIGGLTLLQDIKAGNGEIPIIMITGYPNFQNAVTAMRYGAVNVMRKPVDVRELTEEIRTILGTQDRRKDSRPAISPAQLYNSKSRRMNEVLKNAERVAKTSAPVMVLGESGTGKELVASLLHQKGRRAKKPFMKINCAAIPETLLESELFGYEKGAFTDAKESKRGKIELADAGTLFLDEIGDMSLGLQAKMLRVLQDQEFERVGGTEVIRTDARFIAATNKDITSLLEEKSFREDLFYRISVVTLEVPPLRHRMEDIPVLVEFFLDYYNQLYGKEITGVTAEVDKAFQAHDWPGNIRELKNTIERAVIFCDKSTIDTSHLPSQYGCSDAGYTFTYDDYQNASKEFDREIILDALSRSDGSKAKAAKMLKIHRKTLYNKMKKLGME
jgi:DNA-binding NtrC family response regulator